MEKMTTFHIGARERERKTFSFVVDDDEAIEEEVQFLNCYLCFLINEKHAE